MASGRPGEGKIGTNTSTVIRMEKPKGVKCDCSKCKHSKKAAGTIYCTWFDIFSPNRKTCIRFTGSLPSGNGKKKSPEKKKKEMEKRKQKRLEHVQQMREAKKQKKKEKGKV